MTVVVEPGGFVRLPDGVRKALAILPGDPLLLREDAEGIVVSRATLPRHLRGSRLGRPRKARLLLGPGLLPARPR